MKTLLVAVVFFSVLIVSPAFGATATGKPAWETLSEKVCGDRLCSEIAESYSSQPTKPKLLSPKKQLEQGVAVSDIICKEGLELIIRHNGNPACVKPNTALKLEALGWGTIAKPTKIPINSFDDCVAAGNPVMESYPRQCRTTDGKHFVESIPSTATIENIPASPGTVVNFYINDNDLNTSPNGIDVIETAGLIEATINGIAIDVPSEMIETSTNSGRFFLIIQLPDTINGRPLSQDDVVLVRYNDQSDYSGNTRVIEESLTLAKTFAKLETQTRQRIGHEFVFRIFEPDANRDSKDEDKISLSAIEFRAEGGIRTNLSNKAFDANRSSLVETGPNSNIFEVTIKIPRTIDGKTIHIGDWFEFRYYDPSTPSETTEKIVLKGIIG